MSIHYYEPRDGHGLPHDPFNAIVGPRPIGWISTLSGAGIPNLAPYSFFNGFNYVPPIVGFASVDRAEGSPAIHRSLLSLFPSFRCCQLAGRAARVLD